MADLPKLELGNETITPAPASGEASNDNPDAILSAPVLNPDANLTKNQDKSLTKEGLTPEERALVEDFSKKIDISNSDIVAQYGAPAQSKIAKFSDSILRTVRTKDAGAVGDDLANLVVEIQNGVFEEEKGGFLKKLSNNAKKQKDKIMANYSKVETNVDRIVGSLEGHQRVLLKDVAMLDEMFKNNYDYFKELSLYIIAGEERLEEFMAVDVPAQRKIAEESNDQMEAQKLNDMINLAGRFEKRLHDLKLSRTISIQMAPQIRMIQNNDTILVEKIQSSILNSIPLWKNQMVIALGLANSKAALDAQRKVTDMTNELLIKNSEMLKQGSIEVAQEAERGIVSIDTVRKTNENLIETINEVLAIQRQGSEQRAQAEAELAIMEGDLKNALLEAGGGRAGNRG